jgi:hypothetical protein
MKRNLWKFIFPLATIILLGLFMWVIYDRFIPIQEGWMQYYAFMAQKGFLPYRDFYYFTQPISLFISQLILKFGDGYILFRYYGMIERIVSILALYYLLSKHFSPTATFIAVVTTTFLYSSFKIDVFYTYFQTTQLFFLLSLICLQRGKDTHYPWLYDFFVGIFASLAFFTKQSSGLLVSIFLIIMMVWKTPIKSLVKRVFSYLLGWTIPTVIILGWLIRENIYSAYLSQVFGGISAKGSIFDILFGLWVRNFAIQYFSILLLGSIILFILWKKKKVKLSIESQSYSTVPHLNYFLLFIFPVYLVGGFLIPLDFRTIFIENYIEGQYLIFCTYFTFYLVTIASIIIGIKWISRKQFPFSISLAELILAAFVWTYSEGLSGQLEIYATLLGTGLVIAFLLDRVVISWKHLNLLLTASSCLVVFVCAIGKNQLPLNWWGWVEFGHTENVTSVIPAFKGFKLSHDTAGIYDKIYQDIETNTTPSDQVYTFPFLVLFNYVTGKMQPTFSPVDYFDVCPDNIAIIDAAKLLEKPPKMIIYMDMPASAIKIHEDLFRNGHPSGQRNLIAVIKAIVIQYNYQKIDSFHSPGWNWPIYVWLKP